MARAYYSTVLECPADVAWKLVRDFNNYPRYIDGVDESIIEDNRAGDAVGAVRKFRYGGAWIRQRLVALSDAERSMTYAGCEPFPFPSNPEDTKKSPAPINYEGTLRVTPVLEGNRAFTEWWITYDCSPDEAARWNELLVGALSGWTASLGRSVRAMKR